MKQEVAYFDQNRTGELINRLSTDTSVVSQCVTMNISDGLRSTIMVCAGVSMMFYMSPELALVGLAIVPPVAGMAIVYGRFVRNITKRVQDSLAEATQVAEERIGNIRTVKAFSQEQREIQTYADRMQHVLELATKESLARGIFYGMTGLSGNAIILSVLYYGGVMVSDANITVGNLSSFLLYAAYIGVSLGGLSSFYSELNRGLGASTRLWDIIDRQPAIPCKGGLVLAEPPKGEVRFDQVRFSYPARPDCPILHDLQLTIPSGKVTAVFFSFYNFSGKHACRGIQHVHQDHTLHTLSETSASFLQDDCRLNRFGTVFPSSQFAVVILRQCTVTGQVGASGSGKSTLAALLLRLYDPQHGSVTLDGVPVSSYDPVWLRSHIGSVSQEPVLFSGSIRDNIVYGAEHPENVSDNQVEWAAKEANAHTFITKEFPEGFNTIVGERGVMLSGGQKQRVAIARALIKNPRILLLDEATSALDAESEHLVQEALERIMKGRTVLTIAHRLSTIKNADQIAVLSGGRVVEIGTYEELMAECEGAFSKLVRHQTFQS
ncbi:ATP-binding cassette sub- B member 10, mitochondrial [Homalodisca vitripennis]|nr:ATP-binding cassette sub- B member 10, mitochondrial [Homalodisca vitripennis]